MGILIVAISVIVVALAVGWILSGVQDGRGIAAWDVAAAEWGRDNASETSTNILDAITSLGSTAPLIVFMVLLGVHHAVRRGDRGPGLYLAVVGIGVTVLNNGLKLIVDRGRPDIAQLAGFAGSSFPSGHSAAAAACWAAMALVIARGAPRNVRLGAGTAAVIIAVTVAATRVLLGVHWLSDVVAGVLVGWAWFVVSTVAFGDRLLGRTADLDESDDERPTTDIKRSDLPTTREINQREDSLP